MEESVDDEQALGNVDIGQLTRAQRNQRLLETAFAEGISKMRSIIRNPGKSPAAAVSAFRAVAEVLQAKQALEHARNHRGRASSKVKSESDKGALQEVLRAYTPDEIRDALDDMAPDVQPTEVDFEALERA